MNQIKNTVYVSEGVTAEYISDVYDGEVLDTYVVLHGKFTIAGAERDEFFKKLAELIEQYRI